MVIVDLQLKLLASVNSSKKEIELGPRPGQRIRSGVFPPVELFSPDSNQDEHLAKHEEKMVDLDESEGERE